MTPDLLVCAPLRVEARSLRADPQPGCRVYRTGYGLRRSARSAARVADLDGATIAVAGLAGGLAPDLRTGDVVVATELHGAVTAARQPADPELLAHELGRAGLRVHLGPILTSGHLVHGSERHTAARTGALAVDMESAVLAGAAGDRPFAVLRVVLDTYRQPLLSPAIASRVCTALRRLRAAGPPLARWAYTTRAPGPHSTGRYRSRKEVR